MNKRKIISLVIYNTLFPIQSLTDTNLKYRIVQNTIHSTLVLCRGYKQIEQ